MPMRWSPAAIARPNGLFQRQRPHHSAILRLQTPGRVASLLKQPSSTRALTGQTGSGTIITASLAPLT